MSTVNVSIITGSWTKIADNSDNDFLITWDTARVIELASTEANTAPTVQGHRSAREKKFTREDLGPGYVWAKLVPNGSVNSIPLTISKSQDVAGSTGGFDSIEGVQKVALLTWNPSTLAWERLTNTTLGGGSNSASLTTKRMSQSPDAIYSGEASLGTAETSPSWIIKKIELDMNGNVTAIKIATGTWNDRVSLTYQ